MTERMQDYRERMDEKGLVQLRIWVKKYEVNKKYQINPTFTRGFMTH